LIGLKTSSEESGNLSTRDLGFIYVSSEGRVGCEFIVAIIDQVNCIRRKRGQIKGLQDNNKSMVIFVLKR
jgi:hypothetical protein